MNVDQIMTRNPICINSDETVRVALRRMLENDIRHLPVLDKGDLVGVVSDKDVRGFLIPTNEAIEQVASAQKRLETPISDLMQSDPKTVEVEDNVNIAIDMMLEERIGAVLVVDPHTGALRGILSYVDILRAAAPLFT